MFPLFIGLCCFCFIVCLFGYCLCSVAKRADENADRILGIINQRSTTIDRELDKKFNTLRVNVEDAREDMSDMIRCRWLEHHDGCPSEYATDCENDQLRALLGEARETLFRGNPTASEVENLIARIDNADLEEDEDPLETEISNLKTPLCIGEATIERLAQVGEWASEDGRGLIAADSLFHNSPYKSLDKIDRILKGEVIDFEVGEHPTVGLARDVRQTLNIWSQGK